jgi:two-component system response regulator YesN
MSNQERGQVGRGDAGRALALAAQQYVEAHSTEKFSLQGVADALFVNGSYLLRVFKANTGHTLLWYHNYVRCERAKVMLMDADHSISQAGEDAGFVSSAHFSHVFKKMTGCTPTEYRIAHRDQD